MASSNESFLSRLFGNLFIFVFIGGIIGGALYLVDLTLIRLMLGLPSRLPSIAELLPGVAITMVMIVVASFNKSFLSRLFNELLPFVFGGWVIYLVDLILIRLMLGLPSRLPSIAELLPGVAITVVMIVVASSNKSFLPRLFNELLPFVFGGWVVYLFDLILIRLMLGLPSRLPSIAHLPSVADLATGVVVLVGVCLLVVVAEWAGLLDTDDDIKPIPVDRLFISLLAFVFGGGIIGGIIGGALYLVDLILIRLMLGLPSRLPSIAELLPGVAITVVMIVVASSNKSFLSRLFNKLLFFVFVGWVIYLFDLILIRLMFGLSSRLPSIADLSSIADLATVVAVLVGVYLLVVVAEWAGLLDTDDDVKPIPEDHPWRIREEWQSDEFVTSESIDGCLASYSVLFILIPAYSVFSAVDQGQTWWDLPLLSIIILTPLSFIFLLVGIVCAVDAVWPKLREYKFGVTRLKLETMPGRLGQSLHAVFHTQIDNADRPEEGFDVSLTCYRRYVTVRVFSDGDKYEKVNRDIQWREAKTVQPRVGSDNTLDIPVSFDVPTDQPTSSPRKTKDRIVWALEATADVPWIEFSSEFEIPVFEPEGGLPESSEEASGDG